MITRREKAHGASDKCGMSRRSVLTALLAVGRAGIRRRFELQRRLCGNADAWRGRQAADGLEAAMVLLCAHRGLTVALVAIGI